MKPKNLAHCLFFAIIIVFAIQSCNKIKDIKETVQQEISSAFKKTETYAGLSAYKVLNECLDKCSDGVAAICSYRTSGICHIMFVNSMTMDKYEFTNIEKNTSVTVFDGVDSVSFPSTLKVKVSRGGTTKKDLIILQRIKLMNTEGGVIPLLENVEDILKEDLDFEKIIKEWKNYIAVLKKNKDVSESKTIAPPTSTNIVDQNVKGNYSERLKKANEFWEENFKKIGDYREADKYRDIIAERFHILFSSAGEDDDIYELSGPMDIIDRYYIPGGWMDNIRRISKSDLDKWANSDGVPITALDPTTTISPKWYKKHSYKECMEILKYGVESEDADYIGQILKRRIEDNVYYREEIIEAAERFQNLGYLSKVTNKEIKRFFEEILNK